MFKLFIFLTLCSCLRSVSVANADDPNALDEEGLTTAELIELRGFKAKNHEIITTDGYILTLVEACNPLINKSLDHKEPILFIHGIRTSAISFVVNSINTRPKDYSELNLNELSEKETNRLLLNDPATFSSLAFAALNFGHKVWLLNRRGSKESRGHVIFNASEEKDEFLEDVELMDYLNRQFLNKLPNLSLAEAANLLVDSIVDLSRLPPISLSGLSLEVNARYWNYSLDEQVKYDIPETIEYILEQSRGDELTVVAHSAGGALTLLTQATNPKIRDKISKALIWAPGLDLGAGEHSSYDSVYNLGSYLFSTLIGPTPPLTSVSIISRFYSLACRPQLPSNYLCVRAIDQMYGETGGQLDLRAGFLGSSQDVASSREYSQLIQSIVKGVTHYFDYGSERANTIAYGRPEAPVYNLSYIDTEGISIWYGNTDRYIHLNAINRIVADLKVPVELHYLNQTGIYFNHIAFMFHKNVSSLLIVPSLKTIQS